MNESFYHSEVKVEALEIIVVLEMVGAHGRLHRRQHAHRALLHLRHHPHRRRLPLSRVHGGAPAQNLVVPHRRAVGAQRATGGKMSVPHHIVDQASPHHHRADDVDRSKTAPPR
uniref:Uncharacterized protein n=1 Tax=Oryza punctata TaxID=4537 RepID=A0A0E0LAI4_ORYPU